MADPSTYRPETGSIPTQPGVYRFRDKDGRVVYVGKAKSLRARLSSYFQDLANLHPRTATMVTTAASVEWTVVGTEVEALQLEYSWIKEFDPRFNVKYRDDKSYPWLAITMNEEFPRVMVGRGAKKKGIGTTAPTATPGPSGRPSTCCCVSFRCGPAATGCSSVPPRSAVPACSATSTSAPRPCVGRVDADEHREIAEEFADFMGGRTDAFVKRIRARDVRRVGRQDYERAARLRDDLGALNKALEKQAVVLGDGTDADVIALAEDPLEVAVQVFHVRAGRIRGQRGWVADRVEDIDTAELVGEFLLQLYARRGRRRDPAGGPRPGEARRRTTFQELLTESRGQQGRDPGAAARRQARPAGDRRQERRRSRWPCTRPSARATSRSATRRSRRSRTASTCRPRRCGSSATTSPTCRAPRSSRRWWSSRTDWPARASTAGS